MTGPAVLLMAHGSPASPDQMGPYLRHVLKGRTVSDEMIRTFQDRYRSFGGRSPLLDTCRNQAEALQAILEMPVRVGMRHWHPFIADAVVGLGDPIVGLPLAPQYSRFSVAEYHHALREATSSRVIAIDRWHRQPKFLEAWASRIRAGLKTQRPEALLFTAHSVPENSDDPYARELRETIEGILPRIPEIRWTFAYQSASPGSLRWLGPDLDEVLRELHAAGVRRVMAAPIGFTCDHAEVLYDLDQLHRQSAQDLGMTLTRCESLNDHPLLIQALADVVRSAL